jgi:DnaK suppressor protein
MDRKKLEEFKKKLQGRRSVVEEGASRLAEEGRSVQEDISRDPGDRANDTYTKEFTFSLSSSQSGLLQMIDGALGRIADGSFGMCFHCGLGIGLKRLEAVPWTRYCIECQTRIEEEGNGHSQTGT